MVEKKRTFSDESSLDKRVKAAWKDYQKQQKKSTKKTTKRK